MAGIGTTRKRTVVRHATTMGMPRPRSSLPMRGHRGRDDCCDDDCDYYRRDVDIRRSSTFAMRMRTMVSVLLGR